MDSAPSMMTGFPVCSVVKVLPMDFNVSFYLHTELTPVSPHTRPPYNGHVSRANGSHRGPF